MHFSRTSSVTHHSISARGMYFTLHFPAFPDAVFDCFRGDPDPSHVPLTLIALSILWEQAAFVRK